MELKEYLEKSQRTLSSQFNKNKKIERLLHGTIGIITEVDELLENFPEESWLQKIRNYIGLDKRRFDSVNALEEIGDITWYAAIFFREIKGIETSDITPAEIDNPFRASLQIMSFSCEILDMMKKKIYYNKEYDEQLLGDLAKEIMSIIMGICKYYDISINDVFQKNISKLEKRYPEKFSTENAINRDLDSERKTLEEKC